MSNLLPRVMGLLISMRLAVACLIVLSIVVFWGTIYQVVHGLHAAQEEFYYSWLTPPISDWYRPVPANPLSLIMSWFPVPVPGGLTVMWVLFVNLFAPLIDHVVFLVHVRRRARQVPGPSP